MAKKRRQAAALPYRIDERGVQVLLVTSRETRRWIVPKGWVEKDMPASRMAATEAMEEAGLIGQVAKRSIGAYEYDKRMPDGSMIRCEVEVFPFRVEGQVDEWKEKGQREARWFTPGQAAMAVDEGGLVGILLAFGRDVVEGAA